MDLNQLVNRITNFGQFIETIEYYNRRVNLYAVDSDYYEVYYNQETNEIEKINLVLEQDLSKYLNRIKLNIRSKE